MGSAGPPNQGGGGSIGSWTDARRQLNLAFSITFMVRAPVPPKPGDPPRSYAVDGNKAIFFRHVSEAEYTEWKATGKEPVQNNFSVCIRVLDPDQALSEALHHSTRVVAKGIGRRTNLGAGRSPISV